MTHASVHTKSNARSAGSPAPKRCAGYAVYDPLGQKIGDAEEVFVDRDDKPQCVRVRIGFFGARSVLIPVQDVETDRERRTLSWNSRLEGKKITPCGLRLCHRRALSTCNLRGRSPPRPSLILRFALVHPNREERRDGNAIRTEVQRSLRR